MNKFNTIVGLLALKNVTNLLRLTKYFYIKVNKTKSQINK